MRAADLSLAEHGAVHCPGLAVPLLDDLTAIADRVPSGKAGTRITGDEDVAMVLAPGGPIGRAVAACAGRPLQPVRAVLFDKSEAVNWTLAWHQDRTIAVRRRHDMPGYGPWTIKQGLPHVQPPFDLIGRMLTLRIHLDQVDQDNAPLLVALGSHRRGFVPLEAVSQVVAKSDPFTCLAAAGDVWIYATPILHASRAAAPGRRRRVLQADFSGDSLPEGLEWLGL